MKNKVDVRKLIKKKYSDNTLELPDLLEEIDLVLNEMKYDYSSKLNTAHLEETEAIFHRMHGSGRTKERPPEPGYQKTSPVKSTAHNIAEADEDQKSGNSNSSNNISTKQIKVSVPDIFSLITNSQMKLGTGDRNLLNDMIENIKRDPRNSPPSWNNTLKSFETFLNEQGAIDLSNLSLEEAASKLIYFNVLKKISQYTAQPGKLFEYIISPLISSQAEVLGASDTNIIDVSDGMGKDYSIKFYTGTKSNLVFAGSYENLKKYCEPENEAPRDVHYILGRVIGNNLIFARFYVSTSLDYFAKKDRTGKDIYSPGISKTDYQVFNMAQGRSGPGIGIYIRPKEEASQFRKQSLELKQTFKLDQQIKDFMTQRSNILAKIREKTGATLNKNTSYKIQVPIKDESGAKTTQSIELTHGKWEKIKSIILDHLSGKSIKLDTLGQQLYEQVIKLLDGERINEFLSNLENYQKNHSDIVLAGYQQDKKEIEQKIVDRKQQIIKALASRGVSIPQFIPDEDEDEDEISTSQDPNISEQQEIQKEKKYTFAFPLKNLVEENKLIDINLGKPEKYNEYQVKIGNQLQEWMINSLENYSKLGSNLTSYFVQGVGEKVPSAKNLAKEAIQNANDIASDVSNIAKSKKHPT